MDFAASPLAKVSSSARGSVQDGASHMRLATTATTKSSIPSSTSFASSSSSTRPSTGSSTASSTTAMPFDSNQLHRPGSAPPNLHLERKYFDFGEGDELFGAPLGAYEDPLGPHDQTDDDDSAFEEKHNVPTSTMASSSPSNQMPTRKHVAPLPHHETPLGEDTFQMRQEFHASTNQQEHLKARSSHLNVLERRKNSIEMFLSQSPSRALGDDFLRLHLDDPGATQFTLASTPKSPRKYGFAHEPEGRYGPSFPPPPPPSQQYQYEGTAQLQPRPHAQPPQAVLEQHQSRGNQMSRTPGHTAAWASQHQGYDAAQQDMRAYRHEQIPVPSHHREYYGSSVPPPPMAHTEQYHDGYTGMQWDVSSVGHANALGMNRSGYVNGHRGYQTSEVTGNRSATAQFPPRGIYDAANGPSRFDSTPKAFFNKRPCKFFMQGHCRLGNKCKFLHPGVNYGRQPPAQEHATGMPSASHGMTMSPVYSHGQQASPMHPMAQRSPVLPPSGNRLNYGQRPSYRTPVPPSTTMQRSLQPLATTPAPAPATAPIPIPMPLPAPPAAATTSPATGPSFSHQPRGATDASRAPDGVSRSLPTLDSVVSLEDIKGNVFAMSKDQNGCRLLQEQLEHTDRLDLHAIIYSESLEHLKEMMMDPFGNYLFQKLLERVSRAQQLQIIEKVRENLVNAALNLHGTRSVQKVVEISSAVKEVVEVDATGHAVRRVNMPALIVDALHQDAVRLCVDSNGNHVIQRALQYLESRYNQFVFDAVSRECMTVGTHRHGCCVLQRCIDAANEHQKRALIEKVEKHAMQLMQDPYGNYVVQYVLDSCSLEETQGLIVKPLGHIVDLSVQKFSSNVVEKCLERAVGQVRQQYVNEITSSPHLSKMIQDQFANYVVQRALSVCVEAQCMELVQAIRPHLVYIKNTSGGRRITARILKRFPNMDLSLLQPAATPPSNEALYTTESLAHHGNEEMAL